MWRKGFPYVQFCPASSRAAAQPAAGGFETGKSNVSPGRQQLANGARLLPSTCILAHIFLVSSQAVRGRKYIAKVKSCASRSTFTLPYTWWPSFVCSLHFFLYAVGILKKDRLGRAASPRRGWQRWEKMGKGGIGLRNGSILWECCGGGGQPRPALTALHGRAGATRLADAGPVSPKPSLPGGSALVSWG